MAGRRWRLFEERKRNAFDIALSENFNVLYGLRFNGTGDNLDSGLTQGIEWNQGESFIIRGNLSDNAGKDVYGFATTLIGDRDFFTTGGVAVRITGDWAFINTNNGGNFSYWQYGSFHEYEIRWLNTGFFEFYRDGVLIGTSDQQVTNILAFSQYLMARSNINGILSSWAGDIESIHVGSRIFKDSNNWDNLTINGAIRVQSTDGGATWNPA